MNLKTPLYDFHVAEKARMVDFAGWDMPVQYDSLTQEHLAVRNETGMFDVSHMGRFWLQGKRAADTLDKLTVSRMNDLELGQTRYTIVCNQKGGAKDDILVTRVNSDGYLAVVNASNREKLLEWFKHHLIADTYFDDCTFDTGMIAIQGKQSTTIVSTLLGTKVDDLPYYTARDLGNHVMVSRTGYTGEDGYEIIAPNDQIGTFWQKARDLGCKPAGLGARDSLRLEMGYPLYGHELTEEITPYEAGVSWTVHLDKDDFIGKEALKKMKEEGIPRRRIGFQIEGRGIPRAGYKLFNGDQEIGVVSSGGFSPVLNKGIGLALVQSDAVKVDHLLIEIRNKKITIQRVKLPFVSKRVKK